MAFHTLSASLLLLTALLLAPAAAHQTIAFPFPVSKYSKCSTKNNCKKACPSSYFRSDVNPDNPGIIVGRGQTFSVRINRNNHKYGFARFSLVSVDDMYDWGKHEDGAFHYMCGDSYETPCTRANERRDCYFDRSGHYYNQVVTAPTHAPDGVYVLGWAWYGGLFEDFFDCTYIEIRGGAPLTSSYTPTFDATNTETGEDGKCETTSNKLGVCTFKKCKRGGPIKLKQQLPAQFDGRSPSPIYQAGLKPYDRQTPSVIVRAIAIRDADNPSTVLYWSDDYSEGISEAHICLKRVRPAITCEVEGAGEVDTVQFFHNGWRYEYDNEAPYDMEDSDNRNGRFDRLKFDYTDTHFSVGCRVKAEDGSEAWKTLSVSTMFDDGSC